MLDPELNRLLQAAANAAEADPEMPYGFDTRVVALARAASAAGRRESWQFARLLPRISLVALVVAAFSSSAAYWQFSKDDEFDEPLSNVYAIADTAIEANFFR